MSQRWHVLKWLTRSARKGSFQHVAGRLQEPGVAGSLHAQRPRGLGRPSLHLRVWITGSLSAIIPTVSRPNGFGWFPRKLCFNTTGGTFCAAAMDWWPPPKNPHPIPDKIIIHVLYIYIYIYLWNKSIKDKYINKQIHIQIHIYIYMAPPRSTSRHFVLQP